MKKTIKATKSPSKPKVVTKVVVITKMPKVKEVKAKRNAPAKFNPQKFEAARRRVFSLPNNTNTYGGKETQARKR